MKSVTSRITLLDKLSNENKDIMIMGNFNISLINYNDDKNTGNFADTMFSQSFLPCITTPTRIKKTIKHLSITSITTSLSIILFLES